MADAPSGGSNWGTFEVILGLLLAIGLLSNISGKPITPVTETRKTQEVNKVSDSEKSCGLSITSPLSLQKVSVSFRLSGSVNGCSWKADGRTALFAQVVNASGKPISNFVRVESVGDNFLNTNFDTEIFLNESAKGTGYVILIPAIQNPDKPITVRIPLTFVTN
jgi:hypothetical protein